MNLQPLFDEPILEQLYLDPGYSGHANDVWLVRTSHEQVVVRAFRGVLEGPFWEGCRYLFGIDPSRLFNLEPLNALLARCSPIPVPRVLRKGVVDGRQCVVVEYMPGRVLDNFRSQPDCSLEQLGRAMAQIHAHRFEWWGSPVGDLRLPLSEFHLRLIATLCMLISTTYAGDEKIVAALEPMCAAASVLPTPAAGALVMVDLDPTQFLTDGERITALVDTEAYVIAPRELDFVGLEYILDRRTAAAFVCGYQSVLPLPDLAPVRPVYRYLYRLLEVQGDHDLDEWMAWPQVF